MMWSRDLIKILKDPRKPAIFRLYDVLPQTRGFNTANRIIFDELKENTSSEEINKLLDKAFDGKSINLKDSYAMNNFLEIVSSIPNEKHRYIQDYLSKQDMNKGQQCLKANIILQLLLCKEGNESEAYQFIVENIDQNLNNELLEIYVFNLVKSEDLSAATTLLHILFKKCSNFTLSNEIWSYYMSKVCELSHYPGATLIYHELIDNYRLYLGENISALNNQNHFFPFLVSNASLEQLALVFSHNKDPVRVKGLLSYFKRFYSYSGHSDTFKALKIALVESYSNEGNLTEALKYFSDLSLSFKGHKYSKIRYFKKSDKVLQILKISSFNNFRWRRDNIKKNNKPSVLMPEYLKTDLDIEQELISTELNSELFNPSEERNVYSSPETNHIPIIDGDLQINDLPYFYKLIYKNVKYLMEVSGHERIANLLNLITSCHYMLHVFIVSSLCELGYLKEAFSIIIKLPKVFPKIPLSILIRDDDYINLFKSCKWELSKINKYQHINKLKGTDELTKLCIEIKNYYDAHIQNKSDGLSAKVYKHFISSLLASQLVTIDHIQLHLDQYILSNPEKPNEIIYLNESDFNKFKDLCNNALNFQSKYSNFIKRRSLQ